MTANRVERASEKKKRRAPIALIVAPIVLVAVAAVVILLLQGGGDVPIIGGGDEPVPEFDFTVRPAIPVATVAHADREALKSTAETTVAEITPMIDDLYTNAFLDPENWRDGDYEEILEVFASDAAAAAEQNLETLTLGATAGEEFESVDPSKGRLSYEVLFDPEGNPDTVVATVVYRGTATRADGSSLAIVSTAEYFLRDVDGWKITAFDVTRDDEERAAPSPTSPGATGPTATR